MGSPSSSMRMVSRSHSAPCCKGSGRYHQRGFTSVSIWMIKTSFSSNYGRILAAGVPIVRPLGDLGGALTFHCQAPGRILVEVAWRPRG